MPELPDVEVYRRYAEGSALHQTLKTVTVQAKRLLEHTTASSMASILSGHRLSQSHRHGKYLFLKVDQKHWLYLHFGMTGFLRYVGKTDEPPKYAQLTLAFKNGKSFAYCSKRNLGKVGLVSSPEAFIKERKLGPDALSLSPKDFEKIMAEKKGMIKTALMDQKVLAGLGNIYTDEVLYQAGVHPESAVPDLSKRTRTKIFNEMQQVLKTAIRKEADPKRMPDDYLLPHRHPGKACPSCQGKIKKMTVGGRSTYFCPACQKKK